MPRGDKSKYTDKQKRQAEHIAAGYTQRGAPKKRASSIAWATVNKESGGGKLSGSGRAKPATAKPATAKRAAAKPATKATTAKRAAAKTTTAKRAAAKTTTAKRAPGAATKKRAAAKTTTAKRAPGASKTTRTRDKG